MAILTDGMDPLAEFVQVNAPSLANGDFGWWHAVRDEKSANNEDPGVGPGAARYEGWSHTCKWIVSLFEREGPFDGVFGFSQGAALAALLVGLRSHDGTTTTHKPLAFDFVIMAGAFVANDPDLARLYDSHDDRRCDAKIGGHRHESALLERLVETALLQTVGMTA
jgi:predicted esterase